MFLSCGILAGVLWSCFCYLYVVQITFPTPPYSLIIWFCYLTKMKWIDQVTHITAIYCMHGMLVAVLAGICFLGWGWGRGSYAMLGYSSLCYKVTISHLEKRTEIIDLNKFVSQMMVPSGVSVCSRTRDHHVFYASVWFGMTGMFSIYGTHNWSQIMQNFSVTMSL